MKNCLRWVFVFLLFLSAGAQAEIFKWVDNNGQVHYDDKPPLQNKNSKQVMDVDQNNNSVEPLSNRRVDKRKKLLNAIDEDRQQKKDQAAKAKKKKAKLNKQCLRARDSLKSYQRSAYVYDLDKDGNRIILPSSARDKVIANLQRKIAANCK